MSFDDGFIMGLSMASSSSEPEPDPEPEWSPPADWIPVPEPGPYEMYFLVAKAESFTFDCQLYDPDLSYHTECTVDWGDGTIEDFDKNSRPGHSYTNGGMYLIRIIADGDPCLFYSCDAPVLIAKLGDEIITKSEKGSLCPFYNCRSYIRQIKIGGKDGIQANEFSNFRKLQKFESTTPLDVIPNNAFSYCYSLKIIDLSHVKSIGKYAFYECWDLNCGIDNPYIDSIEEEAFYGCYRIEKINAPNLATIGKMAFQNCETLKIVIAPNLSVVSEDAFNGCKNLNTIDMSNLISIGNYAFRNCNFKSVDLPKLTEINNGTFNNCRALRTINAPEVTTVGEYAFAYCRSLEALDMPNVTSFGAYAARNSYVSRVYMPNCTSIGDYGFYQCYNLATSADFVVADNCTFGNNCFSEVTAYPPIS